MIMGFLIVVGTSSMGNFSVLPSVPSIIPGKLGATSKTQHKTTVAAGLSMDQWINVEP